MTKCWFCGNEMIWNGDFSFEDYGYEGDGVIAVMSCSNENCGATAQFNLNLNEENDNESR